MATGDETARKERAKKLREQIEQIKKGGPAEPGQAPSHPRSPRDLIHDKMHELDRKDRE